MSAVQVNVSASTIRRRLHEAGLHSKSSALRIPWTPAHCGARAPWCRRHLSWTRQQWSRILFTDESRYTVAFNDGRRLVWRRVGERSIRDAVRVVDRYGGGSEIVWGGIHQRQNTPLRRSGLPTWPTLQGRGRAPPSSNLLCGPWDQAPLCRTTTTLLTEVGPSQTSAAARDPQDGLAHPLS